MIVEGSYIFKVEGYLDTVAEQAVQLYENGWRMTDVESRREWPRFWRKHYTVTFKKDVIVDTANIIETPIHMI